MHATSILSQHYMAPPHNHSTAVPPTTTPLPSNNKSLPSHAIDDNMDLGFGGSNQTVGNAVAQVLLQNARAQEELLDDEMAKYDRLLGHTTTTSSTQADEDSVLEQLRAKRLKQLKQQQEQKQRWIAAGHGVYTEIGQALQEASSQVAKDFFEATKQSERVVVHFYRNTTSACEIVHKHLHLLAKTHLETKFIRINVQDVDQTRDGSGAAFLVKRLGIYMMPTLLCIKNRQAVHHIRGLDELGGTEQFSTKALEYVLTAHGVLFNNHTNDDDNDEKEELDVPPELLAQRRKNGVNAIQIRR